MGQEPDAFKWTGRTEEAATLVALDSLADEQIAKQLDIARSTLSRWKATQEFHDRVNAIRREIKAAVVALGITERQNRIDAYNDRWRRMNQVLDARSEHYGGLLAGAPASDRKKGYANPDWLAPGAETGLLVHTKKMIGSGDRAIVIEEWGIDTSLLKELRAHEEQAAKELGQWVEHKDVTTQGEQIKAYVGVDLDKV